MDNIMTVLIPVRGHPRVENTKKPWSQHREPHPTGQPYHVTNKAEFPLGFVCRGAADAYLSQVRLQSMTGNGPLTMMDDSELDHFSRYACLHLHSKTDHTAQTIIENFNNPSAADNNNIEVRVEWGVLPKDHEKRVDVMMNAFLNHLDNDDVQKEAAQQRFEHLIETDHLESTYKEATIACFAAHVLDRALKTKNGRIYDTTISILRTHLKSICQGAPPDTLLPQCIALSSALGTDHPIAVWFEELAEKNVSPIKRAAMKEKQSRLDAALRDRIMQEQWPEREQLSAELIKEREENTPVPERVWALRNVARTLVMSATPTESALDQSVDLMKKALRLQQKHLGSSKHPGMLGPLRDYARILDRIDRDISVVIWEQTVEILEEITDRYRSQGDLYSAALSAETGLLQGEAALDVRHPSMKRLAKAAENLFDVLDDREKAKFLEIRKTKSGMNVVVDAFTAELGAYKVPGKTDRIEAWNQNLSLDSL